MQVTVGYASLEGVKSQGGFAFEDVWKPETPTRFVNIDSSGLEGLTPKEVAAAIFDATNNPLYTSEYEKVYNEVENDWIAYDAVHGTSGPVLTDEYFMKQRIYDELNGTGQRSLSVGDVVIVDSHLLAVDRVGFVEVESDKLAWRHKLHNQRGCCYDSAARYWEIGDFVQLVPDEGHSEVRLGKVVRMLDSLGDDVEGRSLDEVMWIGAVLRTPKSSSKTHVIVEDRGTVHKTEVEKLLNLKTTPQPYSTIHSEEAIQALKDGKRVVSINGYEFDLYGVWYDGQERITLLQEAAEVETWVGESDKGSIYPMCGFHTVDELPELHASMGEYQTIGPSSNLGILTWVNNQNLDIEVRPAKAALALQTAMTGTTQPSTAVSSVTSMSEGEAKVLAAGIRKMYNLPPDRSL